MLSYAVLGPGGVGGFVAAALHQASEQIVVVARESTAETINADGLSVDSVALGSFIAHPRATPLLDAPVDVLIVATKMIGLDDALTRIAVEPGVVVPLLNGLDGVDHLRQRFAPETVAAGTIRIEADRPQPAVITHTSPFLLIEVAFDGDGPPAEVLPEFAETLTAAGVPTRVGVSERSVLWSKLVRLNALASTTAACDRSIGYIRTAPRWRERLIGCIVEAAAVATADGVPTDPTIAIAELDAVHATLGSSMQRDITAGRTPELDSIQGSVLRAAARHDLACPTITELTIEIAGRAGIDPPAIIAG
jgi:2-dehydropantoate 2-reductase